MIASIQFLRNAIVVIKAPPLYKQHERGGKPIYSKHWALNCSEERWRTRFPNKRSVEEVLVSKRLYDRSSWPPQRATGV